MSGRAEAPAAPMAERAKLLMRAGHAANREGDFAHAREAFDAAFRLTGRIEARVSAANMLLKLAEAEAEAADGSLAGLHAEAARAEYSSVLAHPRCTPSIQAICEQKQAELERLLAELDDQCAAEARTIAMGSEAELSSPSGGKRKRGSSVIKLNGGADALLSIPQPLMEGQSPTREILINRSPVRVLWATVNAQRLGYSWPVALSLGNALAGMVARAKGRALGIHTTDAQPAEEDAVAQRSVGLMGMRVPVADTQGGLRGLSVLRRGSMGRGSKVHVNGDSSVEADLAHLEPVSPANALRSLKSAFGAKLGEVYMRMAALAAAVPLAKLRAHDNAYAERLYHDFRPHIPEGRMGWGQAGRLLLTSTCEQQGSRAAGGHSQSPRRDHQLSSPKPASAGHEPSSLFDLADSELMEVCRSLQVSDLLASAIQSAAESGRTVAEIAVEVAASLTRSSDTEATSATPSSSEPSSSARSSSSSIAIVAPSCVSEVHVREWLIQQQTEGAVYEMDGRFFPL